MEGWPYEVSDSGQVRNFQGRVLLPRTHSHGYLRINACKEGRQRDFFVHRLVCLAFHGAPPAEGMHADHIDGNRANNHANNLRWLSPEENRALRKPPKGERHSNSKLTEESVRIIRSSGFARGRDAVLASQFGVSRETVRDARLGKLWSHVHG